MTYNKKLFGFVVLHLLLSHFSTILANVTSETIVTNIASNDIRPITWETLPPLYAEALPNWTKAQLENLTADIGRIKVQEFCESSILKGATVEHFRPNYETMELTMILSKSSQAIFPKQSPHMIFRSPHFALNGNVTIFFTGWNSDLTNPLDPVHLLNKAYKCLPHHNFLIMRTGKYVENLMDWASYDYRNLSMAISRDMVNFLEKIDLPKIHLVGHGVGAHIAGLIGRYFHNYTGKLIPRITGLDPANTCLQIHDLCFGLQKGDAEFVDIIHSNPHYLGSPWASGDADFYLTPAKYFGCSSIICEHHRAIDYFARTIAVESSNFAGCKSVSMDDVYNEKCFGNKVSFGYNMSKNIKGSYIVNNLISPNDLNEWVKCSRSNNQSETVMQQTLNATET